METYADKLQREEKRGKTEAAAYGISEIDGKRFVTYAMHWDYWAGSLGVVAGEKFVLAAKLARDKNLPLVGMFSSAGVRQQENIAGLVQMARINESLARYKQETGMPYISVLVGEVWGGISASAVPVGDVKIALSGSNYGFAGPRVIESHTGVAVPPGGQSAEAHMKHRNVDVLISGKDELKKLLGGLLHVAHREKRQGRPSQIVLEELKPVHAPVLQTERFHKNEPVGFATFEAPLQEGTETVVFRHKDTRSESLEERVRILTDDARRPDTEFLFRACFEDRIPLYSRLVLPNGEIQYPSIIAGLGKIGHQWFLVIGDQPSYRKFGDAVFSKKPASPTPADVRHLQEMLAMGERLGLPAVFLTDTPGAEPTLPAEEYGQGREIAYAVGKANTYQSPTIPIITGLLGSGGGMVTTPFVDGVAMLSRAMAFVAYPKSATEILYNTTKADDADVRLTIDTIRATAGDLLELGHIKTIIEEPEGGGEGNPHEMAEAVRNYIVRRFNEFAGMSLRQMYAQRERNLASMHKIPMEQTEE